jgi:hypothetical protein
MKVKLTEAQLRSLLRERIARRLLMEESPPPEEPQQGVRPVSFGDVAGALASSAFGGLGGKGPVVNQYTKFGLDKSRSQTAVEAIGQLTGAPTPMGPKGARFGRGAGEAINAWQAKYKDWMKQSITFGSDDPLTDWKRNYSAYASVPGFNPETGGVDTTTTITLPDDARGLLAYLLLVKEGATGKRQVEEVLKILEAESDLNGVIDGWVETFKLSNFISGDEALDVADQLLDIVTSDNGQRNCFTTRYALARFAQKNTKYGETNLFKAFDLGLWALAIAELPASTAAAVGVGIGTGLKGARFAGLAEPLADEAAQLGTFMASKARLSSQLASRGETAVAGARYTAELAVKERALAGALDNLDDAKAAVQAAEDSVETLVNTFKSGVDVADDLAPARDKLVDAVSRGTLDINDASAVADEIISVLPQAPDDIVDTTRFTAELRDEVLGMTAKIKSKLDDIKRAKDELATAKEAAEAAEGASEGAQFALNNLKTAGSSGTPLAAAGEEARIARLAKLGALNPVVQVRLAYRTAKDYAAATGIRGLLGAMTTSGISTTALGLLAHSSWKRMFISRDKLELLTAMSMPDQLGELADEFTNTFFMDPYIVDGIDEIEDAIYDFAAKAAKPSPSDLTSFKDSINKAIKHARQQPEADDQDEEETR